MQKTTINGSLMMLSSSVLFSFMAILVKVLSNTISSFEIVFFRCFISVLIILVMVMLGKVEFKVKEKEKAVFRGIMGGISILLYFHSITLTSVSNAVLLSYTYPIFAPIFSAMYLKEHLTKENIAFILTAFLGIFLVFHFDFSSLNIGDLLALISGITSGMAIVSIRELRKTESSWMIVFSFVLAGSIFSLFFLKGNIAVPNKFGLLFLLLVGIFGTIGQFFMTYAYKHCSTALGGVISMSSVVITAILSIMIFHETLSLSMIIGGILILASATFFSLKEQYELAK